MGGLIKKKNNYIGLYLIIGIVIVIWGLNGWILFDKDDRGTFGDMFGSVNALFSGMAFAALIYTIHLQRNELELQREELSLTRNEIKEQKEYLAVQNEVLRKQNFENTFFQLLNLLQQTRDSFTFSNKGEGATGKSAFDLAYQELAKRYQSVIQKRLAGGETEKSIINSLSSHFFIMHQVDFGHYFRTLYNLIKFVHKTDLKDKRFYTNLIRAQLTNNEVIILFYDCLSDLGMNKFKPLIEEYSILKIIKLDMLLDEKHYILYDEKAYK